MVIDISKRLAWCLILYLVVWCHSPGWCEQDAPPDYQQLTFEPLSWPEPQMKTFTMENGIRFFMIKDHELPLVQVQVMVRSGGFEVPADKTGLARLTGEVMRSGGTAQYPPRELNKLLADKGARMKIGFDFISGSAKLNLLSEDLSELMPVLVDVLHQPAFPNDKIKLAKQQLKTQIARRNDEQGSIAMRAYKRLIYGSDSVYAREPEYQTVNNIDRNDLKRFHQQAYQGANMMVGIAGDFDPPAIRRLFEKEFSVFSKGNQTHVDLPSAEKNRKESALYVIKKSDVNQTYLLMGHLGGRRQNPDYAALQAMNKVLSGGFSGRLFEEVRTQRGLAYAVFGRYGCHFFYPGMFFVGLMTKTATTAQAVRVVKQELKRIQQDVAPQEVRQAKAEFLNSLVFQYARPAEILNRRLHYAYRGMASDSFQQLTREIREVTPDDVLQVAREYLHPDELVVLAVGEKGKLVDQLQAMGKVEVMHQP